LKIFLFHLSSTKIVTGLLFCILIGVGFNLALSKPVWNDEIYTQIASVEQHSYRQMFVGQIAEGNNSPLFYSLQKIICRLFQYQFPLDHNPGVLEDGKSQIILRLGPNVFMSLAICLIFYYFSRYYSYWVGIYGLAFALSSLMVWMYWVEARPYGLWFLLTTVQAVLFLHLTTTNNLSETSETVEQNPESRNKTLGWLIGTHFLLSFTSIFSVAQVVIVALLLRFRDLKRNLFLALGPVCIALFYYARAPKYQFHFTKTFVQLITECVPQDQILMFLLYAALGMGVVFQQRILRQKMLFDRSLREGRHFMLYLFLMFMAALAVLVLFKLGEAHDQKGFGITHRYFIFLTPVSLVATTVFSVHFIRAFKAWPWLRINIVMGLSVWMIINFLRNGMWFLWMMY